MRPPGSPSLSHLQSSLVAKASLQLGAGVLEKMSSLPFGRVYNGTLLVYVELSMLRHLLRISVPQSRRLKEREREDDRTFLGGTTS